MILRTLIRPPGLEAAVLNCCALSPTFSTARAKALWARVVVVVVYAAVVKVAEWCAMAVVVFSSGICILPSALTIDVMARELVKFDRLNTSPIASAVDNLTW